MPANAGIEGAFNRLMGSNDMTGSTEQRFRTATRQGYHAGSYRVRIPHKSINLINIDPPRLHAGCNGIDMHFGGLDFISGEEIKELLTTVAKATPYVAIQMALNKICAGCASTIDDAIKYIQDATALSINSCEAATALIGATVDTVQGEGIKQAGCSLTGIANHTWLTARKKACDSNGMRDTIKELTENNAGKQEMASVFGNETWIALQAMGLAPEKNDQVGQGDPDIQFAYLMMSYIGTTIRHKEDVDEDGKAKRTITMPSTLSIEDNATNAFMDLMLCGTSVLVDDGSADPEKKHETLAEGINNYCGAVHEELRDKHITIYSCKDDEYEECMELENKGNLTLNKGIMQLLFVEINDAIQRVAKGEPLTNEQKALIANAPFPLYRAINVAAVHPEFSKQLLEAHIMPLAYMIASEMVNNLIKEGIKRQVNDGNSLPVNLHKNMLATVDHLKRYMNDAHFNRLNIFSATVETIMTSVTQINQATLSSAMALGITGADFGQAVASGL